MAIWEHKELEYIDLPEEWHDPNLLPDFKEGIRRIVYCVDNGFLMVVFGDKDADGVNGTAILTRILRDIGANVHPYAPTRAEGHGVQPKHLDEFALLGCKLVITVDNGSVAFPAMKTAKEYGIDMVITDHHNVSDKPKDVDFPIINPKRPDSIYPFKGICGATLALKVGQGLLEHYGFPKDYWKKFIDFAGVATVGDVMPLTGENRYIVKTGLEKLNKQPNVGYQQIIEEMPYLQKGDVNHRALGFTFAPMINATGRIETPEIALNLLLNENKDDLTHYKKAEECNQAKRDIMDKIMNDSNIQPKMYPIIWLYSDIMVEGVLGLVANRLGEAHQRPALCACNVSGGRIKGSGRSYGGFPLYDFIMSLPEEWFEARGGHNEALGFTLFQEFADQFDARVKDAVVEMKEITHYYNKEVDFTQVTDELMKEVESREPYGPEYPRPTFVAYNVTVAKVRKYNSADYGTGTQKIGDSDVSIALKFKDFDKNVKEPIDILFGLERAKKSGEVRLDVIDWRIHGATTPMVDEDAPEQQDISPTTAETNLDAIDEIQEEDPFAALMGV